MKIKKDIVDKIIAHAKKHAPIEACGYLAGKDGVVTKHYELTNVDHSEEHFSFDPEEQFKVLKDVRKNELQFYAAYHSHPFTPARPSIEDIELAYDPNISYVIVSLANGSENVKTFKIKSRKVDQEELEIIF